MKKSIFISKITAIMLCLALLSAAPLYVFAASESDLRSSVVSVAQGEVGYTGTSTKSKYGEWYGYQGGWCTTFVLWCFNQAGEQNGVTMNGVIIPRGGNCNSMISWFKDKGGYYSPSDYSPKQGDLVFFDWNDNGSCDHVGIVNYISGSTVYTIEGNCSGKVKAREYTKKGSKPYNNISAIMGYATPKYSSVAGSAKTTAKKSTTKKATTTKKKTTAKKSTTKKSTTKKTTAKTTVRKTTTKKTTTKKATEKSTEKTTEKATSKASTTAATTTEKTTQATTQGESATLTNLTLHASTYDLQVGDSVKLDYSVEPSGSNAVVGYFCDEDSIIQIGENGEIKAIGTGTATVVVCANDDLYSQCAFNVTDAVGEVSTVSADDERVVVGTRDDLATTQENVQSVLTRMGVNVEMLKKNKQLYIIPAAIIGVTAFVSVFVAVVKRIKKK